MRRTASSEIRVRIRVKPGIRNDRNYACGFQFYGLDPVAPRCSVPLPHCPIAPTIPSIIPWVSGMVTSIGLIAFEGCSGLTSAYFQGNAPASFIFEEFDQDAAGFTTPTWGGCPASAYSDGSLQVRLAPAGAASAGAQWQVDGGGWLSGGSVVNLAPCSHTIAFRRR